MALTWDKWGGLLNLSPKETTAWLTFSLIYFSFQEEFSMVKKCRSMHWVIEDLIWFCAGTHFAKAFFVPSMSTYNKVTSGATIPSDSFSRDLSWQFNLQMLWEKIIHGKGIPHIFWLLLSLCVLLIRLAVSMNSSHLLH